MHVGVNGYGTRPNRAAVPFHPSSFHPHWDRDWFTPWKGFHATLNEDSAHSVESSHKDKLGCNVVDGTPYVVFGFLISLLKEVLRLSSHNLLVDDLFCMGLILFEISSFVSGCLRSVEFIERKDLVQSSLPRSYRASFCCESFHHPACMLLSNTNDTSRSLLSPGRWRGR